MDSLIEKIHKVNEESKALKKGKNILYLLDQLISEESKFARRSYAVSIFDILTDLNVIDLGDAGKEKKV